MAFIRTVLKKNPFVKKMLLFFWNGAHKLLWEARWFIEKKYLLNYYRVHKDECKSEISDILYYVRKHKLTAYNYDWCKDYDNYPVDVKYDQNEQRFYVIHGGRRMYMKKGIELARIIHDYRSRIKEQDLRSPHCYHSMMRHDHYGLIVDGGGAEGMFALDYVDKADKVVIIEPDHDWIDALKITFRDFDDRVIIIDKFLSDTDDHSSISMDCIYQEYGNDDEVSVLKMDIEGYEEAALRGGCRFAQKEKAEFIICTYHHQRAEANITEALKKNGFNVNHSNGYIYFPHMYEKRLFPDKKYSEMKTRFRHGVIGASKQ